MNESDRQFENPLSITGVRALFTGVDCRLVRLAGTCQFSSTGGVNMTDAATLTGFLRILLSCMTQPRHEANGGKNEQ